MAKKKLNKYWENEDPIVTETPNMVIYHFPEAGKLQLFGLYEADGEMHRTKAVVLNTDSIEVEEASQIIKALLDAFFMTNVEAGVMDMIIDTVLGLEATAEPEDDEQSAEEVLDEEFEDEEPADEEADDEPVDYSGMSFKELKTLCTQKGIEYKKVGESKNSLIAKLEAASDDSAVESDDEPDEDDTADETESADTVLEPFAGKYIAFNVDTGKLDVAVAKNKRKLFKEASKLLLDCESWLSELGEAVKGCINTRGKNKNKLNRGKYDKIAAQWVLDFNADEEVTKLFDLFALHYVNNVLDGKYLTEDKFADNYLFTPELMREYAVAVDAYLVTTE